MPDIRQRTHHIFWNTLIQDSHKLADALMIANAKTANQVQGIIGVSRGGLVPAAIVAYRMQIRNLRAVQAASYDHLGIRSPEVAVTALPPDIEDGGRGWLIIDDIADSGNTIRTLRSYWPNALFYSLYAKGEGVSVADGFVREFAHDLWISFPWDGGPHL